LEDFAIPHRRLTAEVHEQYSGRYVRSDDTLREVAWDEDSEHLNASTSLSRVFRAVTEAAAMAIHILFKIVQMQVESGMLCEELADQSQKYVHSKYVRSVFLAN
jgi:hypothetical protein